MTRAEKQGSPEERLLEIIEDPIKAAADSPLVVSKPGLGLPGWKGWLERFRDRRELRALVNLRSAGYLIAGFCVLATLLVGIDAFRGSGAVGKRLERVEKSPAVSRAQDQKPAEAPARFDELLSAVQVRNIFSYAPPSRPVSGGGAVPMALTQLKLVGIIWSERPQAMIEDTQGPKTYLVSQGDTVGPFTVKQIFADRATLQKDDQEWQLR